jgi:hypothetical protein
VVQPNACTFVLLSRGSASNLDGQGDRTGYSNAGFMNRENIDAKSQKQRWYPRYP